MQTHRKISTRPFRPFLHLNTVLCLLFTFAIHKDRSKFQPLKQTEFPCISGIRITHTHTHTIQELKRALKKFSRWLEALLIEINHFLLCHIKLHLNLRDLIALIRFHDELKSQNSSLLNVWVVFLFLPWKVQIDFSPFSKYQHILFINIFFTVFEKHQPILFY